MTVLLLAWALAQEIPDDAELLPPFTPVEVPQHEVVPLGDETEVLVVGEQLVADRRDRLVRKLEGLGWKARRKSDGQIVFVGPEGWMGKARLLPSGDITFGTPVLAFDGPRETGGQYDYGRLFDNDQQMGTVGVKVTPLPSKRKVEAVQDEVRTAIEPELLAWREAIQRKAFGAYLDGLPARLDALWHQGVGLDRNTLTTPEARRGALLELWATRTDTPEGRAVTRLLEGFFRSEVWPSEHPFVADEITAAQARREDGRRLER